MSIDRVCLGYTRGHIRPPHDKPGVRYDMDAIHRVLQQVKNGDVHTVDNGINFRNASYRFSGQLEFMGSWGRSCVTSSVVYWLAEGYSALVDPDLVVFTEPFSRKEKTELLRWHIDKTFAITQSGDHPNDYYDVHDNGVLMYMRNDRIIPPGPYDHILGKFFID